MEIGYITIGDRQYLRIQTFASALNVSVATIYNWRRAGHLQFEWPLGKSVTCVSRETVEGFLRLRITEAMGAFMKSMNG